MGSNKLSKIWHLFKNSCLYYKHFRVLLYQAVSTFQTMLLCQAVSIFQTMLLCQAVSIFKKILLCQAVSIFQTMLLCQAVSIFQTMLLCQAVSIFHTMLHSYFHFCSTLIIRTRGQSLETFKRNSAVSVIGEHWPDRCCHIFLSSKY
jgi:hypothetical protein